MAKSAARQGHKRDSHTGRALGAKILSAFRYAHDCLVLLKNLPAEDSVKLANRLPGVFYSLGKRLKFTFELPEEGCFQFLDIMYLFHKGQLCCRYHPRYKKPALSKIVKRGIARNCMRAALKKSCDHQAACRLQPQARRLCNVGFSV